MYSASPLMVAGIGSSPPDKDKLKRIDRLMDGWMYQEEVRPHSL